MAQQMVLGGGPIMTRWLSDDAYFEVVLSLKVKRLILTELNLFRNF